MLQFGEDLLDWVEIGRVFGKEKQFGAGISDRPANGFSLVASKIIHHDEVAGGKRWNEDLLHIGFETFAIDRAVEDPWGVDAVMAKGGQECHGFPVAMWNLGPKPCSARRPSSKRRHVGLGPCLIDEDQALGRDLGLVFFPLRAPARDVRAILLAGEHGFF